ncbi:hypothetical protein HNR53_002678 [Bacillus benzoevorans]|uniref:Glycosyltransferase RgtA/B/C/D-like domain-containing protein n=1 Tax=Bacillus benzoevorans TaxID=1456 RepID=A0A7X0HSI7_9BACI|nr:hypothetical protein [Bacillus benzoevorans]
MYTKQPFTIISPDGKLYMNLAENLLNGHGLINTVRVEDIIVPPLFPLILLPFLGIFKTIYSFFVFQYILYGVNAIILYYLTGKVFKEKRFISWIAVLLYIFNPVLLLNGPNYLLTETVFTFFVLIIAWSLVNLCESLYAKKGTNKAFIMSILIICVSMLLRPHMLFMFPLLGLIGLYMLFKKLLSVKSAVMALLIPVILFGANMMHNKIVHHEAVPFENYSGQNLYIANNPNTKIEFYNTHKLEAFVEPYFFTLSDLPLSEKSTLLRERAIDHILSDPVLTAERVILRAKLFFQGINQFDTLMNLLFALGFIAALIMEKGRLGVMLMLLYYIAGFTALSSAGLLVEGQRYRAPIIPIYLLFSGYIIQLGFMLLNGLKSRKKRS